MALFDNKARVIAGLQKNIDDKNRAISSYYNQIGRLYYGQYTDLNVDVTKEINQRCDNITTLKQDIEDLEIKILYEKGLKRCPVCRTENNLEYDFCFRCGTKFDASATAPAIDVLPEPVPAAAENVPAEEPAAPEEETTVTDEIPEVSGDDIAEA